MALRRTCSECLPVVACDFEPPAHVPRTSARAHTCAVVFGRALYGPRSREHEKRATAAREKKPSCQENTFTITCITAAANVKSLEGLCFFRRSPAPLARYIASPDLWWAYEDKNKSMQPNTSGTFRYHNKFTGV